MHDIWIPFENIVQGYSVVSSTSWKYYFKQKLNLQICHQDLFFAIAYCSNVSWRHFSKLVVYSVKVPMFFWTTSLSLVQSKAFEISLKKQITDKCVSTFQNDDTNDDTTTGTRRTMLRFCRLKEWPTVVAVGPQSENQHSSTLSYVCEKVFTYWVIFLILWHYHYWY